MMPTSPIQGLGTGPAQRLSEANPFGNAMGWMLPGLLLQQAMRPVFEQNLQTSLGMLRDTAPRVYGSAFMRQGQDLAQRALNEFNQTGAGAMLQGGNLALTQRGQDIQREQGLLGLAQQQNQFQSQFGLARDQQRFNQTILPALQLLMALLPMLGPTGYQTVVQGG